MFLLVAKTLSFKLITKQVKSSFNQIKKLELHSDILSFHEIQKTIAQEIQTPEKKLIESLKNKKIDLQCWYKIKKSKTWSFIPIEDAIGILKALEQYNNRAVSNFKESNNNETTLPIKKDSKSKEMLVIDNIYSTFISYFKSKLEYLTVSQMATILQKYAYANRFDQSFFREFENELYERFLDKSQVFQVSDVEKILWAYQYCYYGSAILYKKLSQTIKIAQFEIHPLKLAYFAYLFTKSPETLNVLNKILQYQGGYGIYTIAEERVKERIEDLGLSDLIKLTKYFYVPNIGSNAFQITVLAQLIIDQLEEKICAKIKSYDKIPISNLVALVKTTSKYIFRYNDKALYHKIESACIELLEHLDDNQFSEVIWSFLRSRRGNHTFYEKAEQQLKKRFDIMLIYEQNRVKTLTFRQATLLYIHSSRSGETQEISNILLKGIISKMEGYQDIQKVKLHYIVYLLIAVVKQEYRNKEISQLQAKLIDHVLQNASASLTKQQQISLLSALTQSLLDPYQITLIRHLLKNTKFEELNQDHKIIFKYANSLFGRLEKFNLGSFCLEGQVNKQIYHQALYLFPREQKNLDVLDLLYHSKGLSTRFCFRQDNWVLISWVLLSELVLFNTVTFDPNIINQACEGVKEIEINTLNLNNLQKYAQSLWMVKYAKKIPEEQIYYKVLKLIKSKAMKVQVQLATLNNFNLIEETWLNETKELLLKVIKEQVGKQELLQDSKMISYVNLFDSPSISIIPVACIVQLEESSLRFGLIPLSLEYDFTSPMVAQEEMQNSIGRNDQEVIRNIRKEFLVQKWVLQEQLGWNIEFIIKEVWDQFSEEQKLSYLKQIFTIEIEEQQDEVKEKARKQKRKSGRLQEKLKKLSEKQSYLEEEEAGGEEL